MLELSDKFNEDYFERGSILGISGYINYCWMPELTIPMVHHIIRHLDIKREHIILDYGCAKGFVVKAFRLLGLEAYGVDISEYAISQTPNDVKNFCKLISKTSDIFTDSTVFDWLISKDVLEHIPEEEIIDFLSQSAHHVKRMFVAIPLGIDDSSGKFVIPAYANDKTHITIKTFDWWHDIFNRHNWNVKSSGHYFFGVKEHWQKINAEGNGFFVLESKKLEI